MIQCILPPMYYEGVVRIPASKSHAQRVLACALLSDQRTTIQGLGNSDDENAALGLLEQTVCKPYFSDDILEVPAGTKLHFVDDELSFGESGLSSRMFTPILANGDQELTLTGKGSLTSRPMRLFDQVFPQLKVDFSSNNGTLPFKIKGPIIPKNIDLDGSLSSQFITGFIYAYAGNKLTRFEKLRILNPASVPYIELSLDVLREFGVNIELIGNEVQFNGPYHFKDTTIAVEGDWSSASFLLVGAALFGSIRVNGLRKTSKQADILLLQALMDFGAEVTWEDDTLVVSKKEQTSFDFDATHCPDLFPPLAVLASFGSEISRVHGVHRLFSKESNRAVTIVDELSKLGAVIEVVEDTMVIYPRQEPLSFEVSSRHDHRIAMACGIFALGLNSNVFISDAEAVSKSFPEFFTYIEILTQKL
jgi:3-phosphoshikimate 1-carboxyvinyltransferase